MKKNNWKPIFFIAFKERTKEGDIDIVIYKDKQYYHSKDDAEKAMEEFREENYYQDDVLEVIKLWQKQAKTVKDEN